MKYGYRLTLVGRRKAAAGLIAKFGKEVVNLAGVDITHTYPETRKSPERTVTFPAATMKHLKIYFDRGFQTLVERYEVTTIVDGSKIVPAKRGNEKQEKANTK